ncbi:MAG: hypothetical protein NTV72_00430 [Candidatus Taylorbacteria bacterium]|nr:hypothetical protein [Candidatus Taylorbacteria bacterium]
MIEIIPAILPKDFHELEEKMSLVKGAVSFVQIDVMDKTFTQDATWPYRKPDDNFRAILAEERGMPFWEEMDFEADLMIKKPEEVVEDWIMAGAVRLIIHANSTENLDELIKNLSGRVEIILGLEIDTDISIIDKYIEQIQGVQCMGIAKIGFQGQPFDERVVEKVRLIRSKYPSLPISVDGGEDLEHGKLVMEAGATRLVCGSYIYNSQNVFQTIEKLKSL